MCTHGMRALSCIGPRKSRFPLNLTYIHTYRQTDINVYGVALLLKNGEKKLSIEYKKYDQLTFHLSHGVIRNGGVLGVLLQGLPLVPLLGGGDNYDALALKLLEGASLAHLRVHIHVRLQKERKKN